MKHDGATGSTGQKSPRCVAGGTQFKTPKGTKTVEELRVGDQVWGFNIDRNEPVITKITSWKATTAKEIVRVGDLCVTTDHPIFVEGEWKPADKLKSTDKLLGDDLAPRPVGEVERLVGEVEVYDIAVAEPQTFFASGILVHNNTG